MGQREASYARSESTDHVSDREGGAPGRRTLTGGLIRRKAEGDAGAAPDAALAQASSSAGTSLPSELGGRLSSALGASLDGVRVHTDAPAAAAASSLGAQAFAFGQDVYFGGGHYSPETHEGQHLIAHEVAHTVQAPAAGPRTKLEVSAPGDAHEVEADAFAASFVAGGPSPSLHSVSSGSLSRSVIHLTPHGAARAPAPAADGKGPKITLGESKIELAMPKQKFLDLCGQCTTEILSADQTMRIWLSNIAVAYRDAWISHTDTLKEQDESNQLVSGVIIGAAMMFVGEAAASLVGVAMAALSESKLLEDGVGSLATYGVDKATEAMTEGSGLTPFPEDPSRWRDLTEARVTAELNIATRALAGWQDKANRDDPSFFMNFNPVEVTRAALRINGKPTASLPAIDIPTTANLFEKGWWAEWLMTYGYTVVNRPTHMHGESYSHYQAQEQVGGKIKDRCAAIGLDTRPYLGRAEERADDEAKTRQRQSD